MVVACVVSSLLPVWYGDALHAVWCGLAWSGLLWCGVLWRVVLYWSCRVVGLIQRQYLFKVVWRGVEQRGAARQGKLFLRWL